MSSLDGGPLLQQPNDGKHGSGRGDGLSVTATTEVSAGPGSRPNGPRSGLGSAIFFYFHKSIFLSVGNSATTDTINHLFFVSYKLYRLLEMIRNISFQPIPQILFVVVVVKV
jgi:hypothetical protein